MSFRKILLYEEGNYGEGREKDRQTEGERVIDYNIFKQLRVFHNSYSLGNSL